MSQYPGPHLRDDGCTYTVPAGQLFCAAAGCRYQPSEAERQLWAAQDEDAPIRPRWAIEGSDLCGWHAAQLGRVLVDLVEYHGYVEKALLRRSSTGADDARVRTSGIRDVGDFWNPTAARVLADLRDWARDLTSVVLNDRPLPDDETVVFDRIDTAFAVDGTRQVTITRSQPFEIRHYAHGLTQDDSPRLQLAALAKHHSRWLALYPGLGADVLAEALRHRRHAIQAVDAQAFRKVALPGKTCSVVIQHEEFGDVYCHGQLVGIIQDPAASPRPSAIVCSNDPAHLIPRDQWMAHAS